MNLAQARALVKLLEDAGADSWAKIDRPADINSTAYEITVRGDLVADKGRWEVQENGEAAPID